MVLRELSSCIIEKFNKFNIVCVDFDKKLRQPFCPIDKIYKRVKKCDEIINCYFSEKLNVAFQASFSEGTIIKHCSAWQHYVCSNYYSGKDKFDRHVESCTDCPGYIYNFNMQMSINIRGKFKI